MPKPKPIVTPNSLLPSELSSMAANLKERLPKLTKVLTNLKKPDEKILTEFWDFVSKEIQDSLDKVRPEKEARMRSLNTDDSKFNLQNSWQKQVWTKMAIKFLSPEDLNAEIKHHEGKKNFEDPKQ